jgi:hypothetical protein
MFGKKNQESLDNSSLPQFSSNPEGGPPQIVYVQAPAPQKKRGCLRIFGGLALIGIVAVMIGVLALGGRSSTSNRPETQPQQDAQAQQAAESADPTEALSEEPTLVPVVDYQHLTDLRELVQRPGGMVGDAVSFDGIVANIEYTGEPIAIGDNHTEQYDAFIQVGVEVAPNDYRAVVLGYNGSMEDLFEETPVRVFGTVVDTAAIILEASGGLDTQAVVKVDRLEIMD